MAVILSAEQLADIRQHAETAYPHEGCGLMGGATDGEARRVARLVPVPNARSDSPRNRYLIEPDDFLRAQATLDRDGLEVIGVYHSHPDHPARPSAFDEEHAWPRLSYIIINVARGAAGDARSWVLADDRGGFVEESITIEERVAT